MPARRSLSRTSGCRAKQRPVVERERLASWTRISPTCCCCAVYFFETRFDGQRHPHYGRFLTLEQGKVVEMTWLTATGTRGVETVVTIELEPSGSGTRLSLTHAGFPDEELRDGHAEAWPAALDLIDKAYS